MMLGRAAWTLTGFAFSMIARFGTNLLLSRILMPEILGIMVIVSSVRIGLNLLSDFGIEQNIVHSDNGLSPSFLNTAWTIQVIRGLVLTVFCLCISPYLASLYHVSDQVFFIISFAPLIGGFASTAIPMMVKNLEVKRRNLFEMFVDSSTVVSYILPALISPTVWGVLTGVMLAIVCQTVISYVFPHPRHRLVLTRQHVSEILVFGRWIMITSLLMYITTNFDRIFLGQEIPLALLGTYGLARTISELPSILVGRLASMIVFPMLVRVGGNVAHARQELGDNRLVFTLVTAFGIGTAAAWSDWAINLLYDPRYLRAGWMLFILLLGTWPAVLSGLNEAVLLGFGKPSYCSAANGGKMLSLCIGLPFGFWIAGLRGSIIAIAVAEVVKYGVLLHGQYRIHLSFTGQDGAATFLMLLIVAGWLLLRARMHLGAPW